MAKLLIATSAVFAIMGAAAIAQASPQTAAAPVVWQGGITITSVSKKCGDDLGAGDFAVGVFRPRLGSAKQASALSIFFARSAKVLTRKRGGTAKMHGSGKYVGTLIDERANTLTGFTGKFDFALNPNNPGKKDRFLQIIGKIGDYSNISGCRIKFNGAFARR